LLTGERLFKGEDVADTLAQVLTQEVDVARVPGVARRLIAECLQRDPKARLRDIGDAKRLVGGAGAAAPVASARASIWPWVAAAVFAVATGVAVWAPWRSAAPVSELRFEMPRASGRNLFLSPDGQRIALASDSGSIAIRELNALETRDFPLSRVSAAQVIWSPDSRSVAYQSRDYRLMRMALDGSPPVQVGDLPALGGGSWSQDGVILVGVRRGGLQRIPATGGTLTPVTTLAEGQTEHSSPQFIDGDRFLYQASGEKGVSGIYLASLTRPEGTLVLPIENAGRNDLFFTYVPALAGADDAHIVYTSQDVVLAQAVDPSSLALRGSATSIGRGANRISASQNGTLVYYPLFGNPGGANLEWQWLDRSGAAIGVAGPRGVDGRISPSGTRWARVEGGDIWLHDVAGGAPSRFTFEPTDDRFFAWSPDDQWIAYATGGGRAHDRILRKNTLTSTAAETVVSGGTDLVVGDWSRDGKFLLFADLGTGTSWDLWTLDLHSTGATPVPYLQTPAAEYSGRFSPDGRWIAYGSDESGQGQVYVQSFPLGGGKFQVSTEGGGSPRWRADGRELYFLSGPNMVAVPIQTSPRFEAGEPRKLFVVVSPFASGNRYYDVTPDGNRFLVLVPVGSGDQEDVPSATVVVNWQAGLKKPQ
jgi:Tol biopolymer transport system component